MDIEKVRKDTPCGCIYMNHASTSVPPIPVIEAVNDYYRMIMEYGATSRKAEKLTEEVCNKAIKQMAQFLNASEEEIQFVPNGTVGIEMAAQGMRWRKGQNILIDSMSFVSNVAPWIRIAETYDLEIRYIPAKLPGLLDIEKLEGMIDSNTALISVTHVANSLGICQDIECIGKIAEKYQIPYLVDAAGSLGAMLLDVKKIKCDFLTASGRKYLRGPAGTGVFFVKKENLKQLKGYIPAWNSGVWDYKKGSFEFHNSIKKYEYGEKNYPGIFGLLKAVEYIDEVGGIEAIEKRNEELMKYLIQGLQEMKKIRLIGLEDVRRRCGTIGFVMEGKTCDEIAAYLNQNQVGMMGHHFFCPGVIELFGIEGVARLSLHYWNTQAEIDEVLDLLKKF